MVHILTCQLISQIHIIYSVTQMAYPADYDQSQILDNNTVSDIEQKYCSIEYRRVPGMCKCHVVCKIWNHVHVHVHVYLM